MKYPKVSFIIPSWNRKKFTLSCVKSVTESDFPKTEMEIIVVDNGSIDNTVDALKKAFPQIKIIELDKNYGFSGAINRGLKVSRGKYVVVLQSDLLVDKNYLRHIVEKAGKSPEDVGVFGPKVYLFGKDKVFIKVFGKINPKTLQIVSTGRGEKDRGQYDKVDYVGTTAFSGVLIKKEVFKKIGQMEERFCLYFEDNDFFVRAKKAGYRFRFVPEAFIWDRDTRSFGKNSPSISYYLTRNNLLLLSKNSKISIPKHLKNLKFLLSSYIQSVFWAKKREHARAVSLGILDFYLGRFGERRGF